MMILAVLLRLLTENAAAQPIISGAAQQVAGPLRAFVGIGGIGVAGLNNLADFLLQRAWVIAAIPATYNIVRAGIRLISSEEEDKLSKARQTIVASLVAIMALYLTPRIVRAIFMNLGAPCPPAAPAPCGVFATPAGVEMGVGIFITELQGLISWVEVLIVPIAIGAIIYSAFQVVASFGKEEGPEKMRKAIGSVIAGIILLLLRGAIKATLGVPVTPTFFAPFQPSTGPIVVRVLQMVSTLLMMLSVVAVALLVFSGVRLIVSAGNEEDMTKAKARMGRIAIGFLIIFLSYAISLAVTSLLS